jgi:hypothetical protein
LGRDPELTALRVDVLLLADESGTQLLETGSDRLERGGFVLQPLGRLGCELSGLRQLSQPALELCPLRNDRLAHSCDLALTAGDLIPKRRQHPLLLLERLGACRERRRGLGLLLRVAGKRATRRVEVLARRGKRCLVRVEEPRQLDHAVAAAARGEHAPRPLGRLQRASHLVEAPRQLGLIESENVLVAACRGRR